MGRKGRSKHHWGSLSAQFFSLSPHLDWKAHFCVGTYFSSATCLPESLMKTVYPPLFLLRFLKIYLLMRDTHRERKRDRDPGRGRSSLPAGSLMWDTNRASGITLWVKGSQPLSHPGAPYPNFFTMFFEFQSAGTPYSWQASSWRWADFSLSSFSCLSHCGRHTLLNNDAELHHVSCSGQINLLHGGD